jgi:hypothetical protein
VVGSMEGPDDSEVTFALHSGRPLRRATLSPPGWAFEHCTFTGTEPHGRWRWESCWSCPVGRSSWVGSSVAKWMRLGTGVSVTVGSNPASAAHQFATVLTFLGLSFLFKKLSLMGVAGSNLSGNYS